MSAVDERDRDKKGGFDPVGLLRDRLKATGDAPRDRRQASRTYKEAQLEDLGLLNAAERQKNSERRDKRFLQVVVAALLFVVIVLATKDHTDALLYRESPDGHLTYMGRPTHDVTPDDAAVDEHLARWIQLLREVHEPTDGTRLATDRDALYAMTQAGSKAAGDVDAYRAANPPEVLGRTLRRNDRVTYVAKIPGTQRGYEADVEETTAMISGPGVGNPPTVTHFHFTFTIAKPRLATTEATALVNGAGVYVSEWQAVQKQ